MTACFWISFKAVPVRHEVPETFAVAHSPLFFTPLPLHP